MEYKNFENLINSEEVVIVLDTNVILDLARYSLYTSKNILDFFNKCKSLLWIPNQVLVEYNKNKHRVFGDLKKRYSLFENSLIKAVDKNSNELTKILNKSHQYKYFGHESLSDNILSKMNELKEIIKEYKDTVGAEYNVVTTQTEEIIEEIEKFVSCLETNFQVGKKVKFSEKLEIIREGELRYRYKLPPGYEDEKDKEGIEKFGDLFVWKEILKLPSTNSINNIIFITNDDKEDWWQKDKSRSLHIRPELLEEFEELNPGKTVNFMSIGTFQKYCSKMFNLYEISVYIDLNRNDELYIERISQEIANDLIDELYDYADFYLDSEDTGSEGFEDVEIGDCNFIEINEIYSYLKDGKTYITYELDFEVRIYCNSYDYWGRDDDTKEVIKSPPIEHVFYGPVTITLDRIIEEDEIVNNSNFLLEDEEYTDFGIIANAIEQVSVNDNMDSYYDDYSEEIASVASVFTCPRCGRTFPDHSNDCGGGVLNV